MKPGCTLIILYAMLSSLRATAMESVTIGVTFDFGQNGPFQEASWLDNGISNLAFEPLIRLGSDYRIQEGVAAFWESDKSGVSFSFTLRPDSMFHSGRRVTASDFVFAHNWIKAKRKSARTEIVKVVDSIASIVAASDNKLIINLNNPVKDFLYQLALTSFYPVPSEAVGQHGWKSSPVGNGPLQVTEYSRKKVTVVPFKDKDKYAFQSLTFSRVSPESDVSSVDVIHDSGNQFPSMPGWTPVVLPGRRVGFLFLNTTVWPFNDATVRRALTCKIDRKPLEMPLGGEAIFQLFPPFTPGFSNDARIRKCPESNHVPKSPSRAVKEQTIPFFIPASESTESATALVKAVSTIVKPFKIHLTPVRKTIPDFIKSVGKADGPFIGYISYARGSNEIKNYFIKFIEPESPLNFSRVSDPGIESLYYFGDTITDESKQILLLEAINTAIVNSAYYIPLVSIKQRYLVRKGKIDPNSLTLDKIEGSLCYDCIRQLKK